MARHRPWYAHAGTTPLVQPAATYKEEPCAMRLLAELEHELGDHAVAHLAHPDPAWILQWHRHELRAHGVEIAEPEPPRRRSAPNRHRRRRAA